MKNKILPVALATVMATAAFAGPTALAQEDASVEAMSLFGEPLRAAAPSARMLEQYQQAKEAYEQSPSDALALIWYGRRTAYLGEYRKAIEIFSKGIEKHPKDARMYRHRGHRYISVREFDAAVADFEVAAKLIAGQENAIEPDGMPNKYNVPLTTTHGNIWYHLGLAYYLKQDFENAYRAFSEGHRISTNDDGTVSTAHWLYMILRRLGREDEAEAILEDIHPGMTILENGDYLRLCLFYKGDLSVEGLGEISTNTPGGSAAAYGLANWYYYTGQQDKSDLLLEEILTGSSWSAFGYIAAEADLAARR